MRTFFPVFFFILTICASAQTTRLPVSAGYTQLNTYSLNFNDAFSFSSNQAALASGKNFSAGMYGERRFMLQNLSTYQLAIAFPTSSGNFGLQANYFGNSSYNESELGFAYGRNLGKIDIGAQFNYYRFKIEGYGTASAINFEAGAILHVNEQFQTGIHVYNPTGASIGKNAEEKLPAIYSIGFGYDVSNKFFIGSEIEKLEDQPINVKAGFQYAFDKKFFVRTGISSATSSFYFGLGFLLDGFRIDATATIHQQLGMTPGLLLIYNSPEKN